MKFSSFSSFLSVALMARSVWAQDAAPACDATYSVHLDATFPDDIVVKCSSEDMDIITNVIHSVVELDAIASRLAPSVPDFALTAEAFGPNATIDDTGMLAATIEPDPEEVIEHLTVEDILEDIYYETGAEPGDDERRRQLLERLTHTGKHLDGTTRAADADVEGSSVVTKAVDDDHRRMQSVNCGILGSCYATWCCRFCNHCRRRLEKVKVNDKSNLRATITSPGDEKKDEEYLHKLEIHEQRVSKEILKKSSNTSII